MRPRTLALAAALLVAAPALAGCIYDSRTEQGPTGQSSSFRSPTQFSKTEQWTVAGPEEVRESWDNPFPRARVDATYQIGPGRFTLRLEDASGAAVFETSITGPAQGTISDVTEDGEPGTWTVAYQRATATGQMTLNAQSTA